MSSSTTLLGLLGDKSYKIWSQNHTSNALNDLLRIPPNKYKRKSRFILINTQRRSSIR